MNLIVAADKNWGIGNKGDLLFRNPEDMKYFKSMTTGKVVVMGMKTLESFKGKKPLPHRTNIVLTRQDIEIPGCIIAHSVADTIEILSDYDSRDIFVIGGGQVYSQFLDFCDRAYVTLIDTEFDADTFFPNLDNEDEWVLSHTSEGHVHNGIRFMFSKYKRIPQE